jgi:hypothetical protein
VLQPLRRQRLQHRRKRAAERVVRIWSASSRAAATSSTRCDRL